MGKLRRPRQHPRTEPDEEAEQRLKRGKTGGQAPLDQQGDRQRGAEQVISMQIGAAKRGQQQHGNRRARPRGEQDGSSADHPLHHQRRGNAQKAETARRR